MKALKRKINSVHDILQLEELKSRKRVLRRLGFTTSEDVVEMKGRVACEISTGDELLLTEMMFGGVFNPLSPEQCAALLSCFVFQEKVSLLSFCASFAESETTVRSKSPIEGGASIPSPYLAGDCSTNSQNLNRVWDRSDRGRICPDIQSGDDGRCTSMV